MEHSKILHDGITFDDVLLIPARSDFVPAEADTHTRLTRSIELNIPLVSAPMDTVTEAALAIALAQEGGIGIVHKNLSAENQAREVEKVKRSENGVIGPPGTPRDYPGSLGATPIFLGCGDPDPHIPFARVLETEAVFQRMGAAVELRRYPGRPHTISGDELDACRALLRRLIS